MGSQSPRHGEIWKKGGVNENGRERGKGESKKNGEVGEREEGREEGGKGVYTYTAQKV